MKRLLPQSLMGQMLLAVALALLLLQGIGAALVHRAQAERQEAAIAQAAAFRLQDIPRAERGPGMRGQERRVPARRGRGPQLEFAPEASIVPSEERLPALESEIAALLAERGMPADDVRVVRRVVRDDPVALLWAERRAQRRGQGQDLAGREMFVVSMREAGGSAWRIARLPDRREGRGLVFPLLVQTALIYLVVMAVIALVLRRITRPLAALTGQVRQFARDPASPPRLAPSGPSDIRDLISAQNAAQSRISALLDEKDVMLGAIGHDLKTPLAALRVRIESVEDEAERARMAATIADITASLDDILALARVGRPTDAPERTNLAALLASLVEEYEDMGDPVTLDDGERVAAPVRETWLRRAVRNLIGNALRYGETARVSLASEEGEAVIAVEDEGPGIPENEISAMLEPFARGDPSRNRQTGGAGLGLALARAIAEQHGGTLHLSNRAESGLRAEIRLPLTG